MQMLLLCTFFCVVVVVAREHASILEIEIDYSLFADLDLDVFGLRTHKSQITNILRLNI